MQKVIKISIIILLIIFFVESIYATSIFDEEKFQTYFRENGYILEKYEEGIPPIENYENAKYYKITDSDDNFIMGIYEFSNENDAADYFNGQCTAYSDLQVESDEYKIGSDNTDISYIKGTDENNTFVYLVKFNNYFIVAYKYADEESGVADTEELDQIFDDLGLIEKEDNNTNETNNVISNETQNTTTNPSYTKIFLIALGVLVILVFIFVIISIIKR